MYTLSGGLTSGTDTVPDDPVLTKHWQDVLASYRARKTAEDFATWLELIALVELVDGTAVIATPNVFVRDVVADRYQANLRSGLAGVLGELVTVQLIIR
ncbi:MAG TPA: DnaA N-terminal domain-containing protein [Herpetosiphonaceae bacterium]|nr:DnaA N-terminal domain-containing protein [Herpetosiphonaceae bacterium]